MTSIEKSTYIEKQQNLQTAKFDSVS